MKIEQIYTGCLAQGAYYITSNGEAAIIDPLRETQPYLNRLERDSVNLKYIFETHFHADFVSGHLDLSRKTGAPIVYGPNANPDFAFVSAADSQIFEIGSVKIKVLHTPGHTMESCSYLLIDENQKECALFSGDTLFIGDVGRPDLAQKSATMTQEDLAGILFDSLRTKIMTLDANVVVYPAHGAGSACGKNMSKETVSTIGEQKKNNYALRASMTKNEFINEVTDGLLPPPLYFGSNVAMNKSEILGFDTIFQKGTTAIDVHEFNHIILETAPLILDTRNSGEFSVGHVPMSINIGINGDFAPWVGAILADTNQQIMLVTEIGMENETVTRLARVGFDNIIGYLDGGIGQWTNAGLVTATINRISSEVFEKSIIASGSKIIDVRKISEYEAEHVAGAYSRPLSDINNWCNELTSNEHFFLHCAGGYRSMIAASILQSRRIANFSEIDGGFNAIAKTSVLKSDFMCQSKL